MKTRIIESIQNGIANIRYQLEGPHEDANSPSKGVYYIYDMLERSAPMAVCCKEKDAVHIVKSLTLMEKNL